MIECFFLLVGCTTAHAGSERPPTTVTKAILDATEEQLKNAQAKITYLGEQDDSINTVAFSVAGFEVLERFRDFQPRGEAYDNDDEVVRFTVTPGEFRRMLQAVKPVLTKPDAAKGPEFLSFGVIRQTDNGFEGYEFRIGEGRAEDFYRKLIDALNPKNDAGRKALTDQFNDTVPACVRSHVTTAKAILEATEDQLKMAHAKFTYLGQHRTPVATVIFSANDYKVKLHHFYALQPKRDPYSNDELRDIVRFRVSPSEFRRVVTAVKSVVTKGNAAKGPEFLAFAVIRETDTAFEGHEFRIGRASAQAFYRKLIDALDPKNKAGREALTTQFENVISSTERK